MTDREPDMLTWQISLMPDPARGWWIWPLLFVLLIGPWVAMLLSLEPKP